jgi:hypothetical protein
MRRADRGGNGGVPPPQYPWNVRSDCIRAIRGPRAVKARDAPAVSERLGRRARRRLPQPRNRLSPELTSPTPADRRSHKPAKRRINRGVAVKAEQVEERE